MKRIIYLTATLTVMLSLAGLARAQSYTFSVYAGKAKKAGFKDGTGTNALFNQPHGICVDSAGNLYIADTGNKAIREIQPGGMVVTFTNHQTKGMCDTKGMKFSFSAPLGVAIDAAANLYVSDVNTIYKVSGAPSNAVVADFAGSKDGFADGIGAQAKFDAPCGLAFDSTGNLWVADLANAAVRKIAPDGDVTTAYRATIRPKIWPMPKCDFVFPPDEMLFTDVALDSSNNVYTMDVTGYIDELSTNDSISEFAYAGLGSSTGIAINNAGEVCVFDSKTNRVVFIGQSNSVTVVGSLPLKGLIQGICMDADQNIYLVDSENDVIYKGTPSYPPFFDGQVALSGGVYWLQFPDGIPFGYYNLGSFEFPLFYHYDMGFEYFFDANDGQSGAYLYDFSSQTFWYTSPSLFPYMYDFTLDAWLYYYPDTNNPGHYTSNPRYFYDFGSNQIITK